MQRAAKRFFINRLVLFLILSLAVCFSQEAPVFFAGFRFDSTSGNQNELNALTYQFQGYTSHWTDFFWTWYADDGLFLYSQLSPESQLRQMEREIGNQLLLDELWIQEGFVSRLANNPLPVFNSPTRTEMDALPSDSDLIITGSDQNPLIAELVQKIPPDLQFRRNRAFYLLKGKQTIFVISGHTTDDTGRLTRQIEKAKSVIEEYDLSKGLAGVHSNYLLITPGLPYNPYDLINKAMQIGCRWVMVSGYNDWLIPETANHALVQIDFPFTFIPGQYVSDGVMYGMETYPNIQNNTREQCLEWKQKQHGYYFSTLKNLTDSHDNRIDGYLVESPTDQTLLDSLSKPIITNTGTISQAIPPQLVLFHKKNDELTRQTIWQAIMQKKAVAVFAEGQLTGPAGLVDALKILMLEKQYLREQFANPVSLNSRLGKGEITITLQNKTPNTITGNLKFQVSEAIIIENKTGPLTLTLLPMEKKSLSLNLDLKTSAAGKDLPIGIVFETGGKQIRSLTHIEVPSPVEIHPLIFDKSGRINYPVTIFNLTNTDPTVSLQIFSGQSGKLIFEDKKTMAVKKWQKLITAFDFSLNEGDYDVTVSATGIKREAHISIKNKSGEVTVTESDLDGDGYSEIIMENSKIKSTLLLFGGRVIEYIVKERNENLLFKLWPHRPPWDGKPRGVRAFYPWGGLEEFTGYPYIGGHIVFKYEILENSGTRGRVRLWANIHGSKIEKIISLYGDSELLEVRYAMDDITPGITVIGINPLIEIGPSTGPEDIYYFPAEELEERRPVLDRYYGDMFFLKEGWAAGYDTEQDISLIVGYPVNDALFMHLWNNHPDNTPTPYFYTELQPWLKIKPGTTTYFSYYLFGQSGDWKAALEKFRELGLVTQADR